MVGFLALFLAVAGWNLPPELYIFLVGYADLSEHARRNGLKRTEDPSQITYADISVLCLIAFNLVSMLQYDLGEVRKHLRV